MYTVSRQTRFKKDVKLAEKRGKNLQKLKELIQILVSGEELDPKYKDHSLIGNYVNT
jgi:mRNA interferase YafQ